MINHVNLLHWDWLCFVLICFPQLLLLYVSSIYTDSCIFLSGGRALSSSFSFCWSLRCPAQICGNGDFDHEKTVTSQKHPAATGLEHCWGWGTFTHSEWRTWIKLPSGLSSSLQFSHVYTSGLKTISLFRIMDVCCKNRSNEAKPASVSIYSFPENNIIYTSM